MVGLRLTWRSSRRRIAWGMVGPETNKFEIGNRGLELIRGVYKFLVLK